LDPFAFLVGIPANQIAGNIRVTGSYKTTKYVSKCSRSLPLPTLNRFIRKVSIRQGRLPGD